MRTTVAVDDKLLERARREATRRHVTVGSLIEEALRRELSSTTTRDKRPAVPVFTAGTGLRPGVEAASHRGLLEAMEDDLPLERRR